ncbi:predicted protein [Nematostella vectensis]|uniref:non-specific serine/threonine protein kinase n=1 Tax=Nematostella vectensis TaxID=45351 RepID=A7RMS8_NEMVE|nr:predicted protein [Nematostella vectensis]|eukprot:XP_001639213.1 predicted protein [Nematostella vectensis]
MALAIKMLFNYSASSQSRALWKEFSKESAVLSICQDESTAHTEGLLHDSCPKYTHLPTHVNILPVLHTFVDDMPHLPDAQDSYPAALPARHGGLGRNRTMFLVMPRFTHTLESYLASLGRPPEVQTSCLLLLQLLNGLVHLQEHQVAHRDLKSDNLLLDTSVYPPRLVICDFGCCLADTRQGLKLPLLTDETDRGGNSMLMAPEVSTAESGPGASIDYTKADVWSAGAIAYEMFGERNPFSHGGAESRTYSDKELPTIDRWHTRYLLGEGIGRTYRLLCLALQARKWTMTNSANAIKEYKKRSAQQSSRPKAYETEPVGDAVLATTKPFYW